MKQSCKFIEKKFRADFSGRLIGRKKKFLVEEQDTVENLGVAS